MGKKKSKISILAEELTKEMKEYDKLIKEETIEDNYFDDFNLNENQYRSYQEKNTISNMKKFIVHFYLELNKDNIYIFTIESDLLNINTQYGYDLIENIVNKINNKSIVINYNSKQYIFSLKPCYNNNDKIFYMKNYELRFYKKNNLKPNFDLPPFFSSALLNNLLNERISLICKNSLYIMLLEKLGDNLNYEMKEDNNKGEEEKPKIRINKNNNKYYKDDKYNCKNNCIMF